MNVGQTPTIESMIVRQEGCSVSRASHERELLHLTPPQHLWVISEVTGVDLGPHGDGPQLFTEGLFGPFQIIAGLDIEPKAVALAEIAPQP